MGRRAATTGTGDGAESGEDLKNERFNFVLEADDLGSLDMLARHSGTTRSAVLRRLIHEEVSRNCVAGMPREVVRVWELWSLIEREHFTHKRSQTLRAGLDAIEQAASGKVEGLVDAVVCYRSALDQSSDTEAAYNQLWSIVDNWLDCLKAEAIEQKMVSYSDGRSS